jgi:putative DNA primase/helicase
MASNYDDVIGQLISAGLQVTSLDIGRMRRCKVDGGDREKRGWYHLHEIRLPNGDDLIVGSYGVWQGNENNATKVEIRKTELSLEQRESLRKRLAEDKRRSEMARKADAERAAAKATAAWRKCSETGASDYLDKKGVKAHGVRFSPQGAMVIPMLDTAGSVHGLQIIRSAAQADARKQLGKEFWPAGLVKKGHFHLIGMPKGLILVAEGYATAASLYEATGIPTAVAFDAGNLAPVAEALRKRYKGARLLFCADDDVTQKCQQPDCKKRVWLADGPICPHCGKEHNAGNAGISCASGAAMEVGGAWVAPQFADEARRRAAWLEKGAKANDFNDLQAESGQHAVRAQVEARLLALGWSVEAPAARGTASKGDGVVGKTGPLRPIESVEELLTRYALVYGQGGAVFDHEEHMLVALSDMRDICMSREIHRAWAEHPEKQIVRVAQVGFDPSESDPNILCNLWKGWPTVPKAGKCDYLLDLLRYMCAGDSRPDELCLWCLRWLAYPIQHPGAKMKTTLVVHGPQGTGKNMFFEAIMAIYGPYGRIIDQSAIEDRFNDWASRKNFLIADEVVARSDLYHVKNKLKAFITGEWIRINPKNMAAYDERNHVNLVFLSNESMPVVLEDDDRRHAVIWTPEKLSPDFYEGLTRELANGGVEALHHHLLHLDLGEFHNATPPPMTDAKRELIDLSKDSPSRFVQAFESGDIEGFPALNAPALLTPCLSSDLYELYTHWSRNVGLKALNQPRFANALMRKHKATTARKRYEADLGTKGPAAITWLPGGQEQPPGESETAWLGARIDIFRTALKDYKGRAMP